MFIKIYYNILILPFVFLLSFIIKKKKGLFVFWSIDWRRISWNSKAMFEFYKKKWINNVFYMIKNKELLLSEKIIYIYSFRAIFLLLKAQYIFTDSSASSVSPFFVLFGNFKIIRLWHWDWFKKINFESEKYMKSIWIIWKFLLKNEYKNNIIIPVWNELNRKTMNLAFLWSDIAKITWLPRNDIFFWNNEIIYEKVCKNINLKQYKKIFIYAPTRRDTESKIKPFSKDILNKINNYLLNNNYLFIISWHIQTDNIVFTEMSNIINNSWIDIQELLVVSDVLITDYSSIFVDFLLTNKPIIFYAYDLDSYLTNDREMYFNYEDVVINDTLVKDENDFFNVLKNIDRIKEYDSYKKEYKKIKDFFHKYQNWWYCKRLDYFIQKL